MALTQIKGSNIEDGTVVAADVADDAVTTAKILNANVTTGKLADNSITGAKIADNSITGAKIAMGSDAAGDIITYNGTDYIRLAKGTAAQVLKMNAGATAVEWGTDAGGIAVPGSSVAGDTLYHNGTIYTRLAKGTASQTLTMNAGATAPEWTTPSGGGIWELIQSQAVGGSTTVASLTVTGLSTTAYHQYAIGLSRIRSVTDAVRGRLQLGDASGIDDGANEYTWTISWDQSDSTTHSVSVNNGDTAMRCIMDLGTATGEGGGAMMYLHSGEYTNVTKSVRPYLSGTHTSMASNGYLRSGPFAGMRNGLINVDRVKFFLTSGNIEAGRMTVWGIKHT